MKADVLSYREAANYVLTFGKHSGRALDQIATTDDGLLYLDWLLSTDRHGNRLDYWTGLALRSYLSDQTIAHELAGILNKRGRR